MINSISIYSYAKINLSIDVGKKLESGLHEVDMIMQQLTFHDDVKVSLHEGRGEITLKTNKYYLPTDERNIAYKAALLMCDKFSEHAIGQDIKIVIHKRIPVGAGLAGGSSNAAAVVHALNTMWRLNLSLGEIMEICSELGSDVPFCAAGQARGNGILPYKVRRDKMAYACARASGTGTEITPLNGIRCYCVIAKPPISISTAEVYSNIDDCEIIERPDNDSLAESLECNMLSEAIDGMVNVLEYYTVAHKPKVKKLKQDVIRECPNALKVMMSGSGPTIFALFDSKQEAVNASEGMRELGYESYWSKTLK